MKRAEQNLIVGIGIGYLLCHIMKLQSTAPTAPTKSLPPIIRTTQYPQTPLPTGSVQARIGRRPWNMQNPLMYMAV